MAHGKEILRNAGRAAHPHGNERNLYSPGKWVKILAHPTAPSVDEDRRKLLLFLHLLKLQESVQVSQLT